jgi:putative ABC transport system substrate-binding protein
MTINIERQKFIVALSGSALGWPLTAYAQQLADKTARIGLLQPPLDNPVVARGYPAFLDELKKSGFSEGQNLTIKFVRLDQDVQQLFAQAAELVRSKVELLVTTGSEDTLRAALAASPTIPIVMWAINFDPIAKGYVRNLAQPGGNVTGIVSLQTADAVAGSANTAAPTAQPYSPGRRKASLGGLRPTLRSCQSYCASSNQTVQ